MVGVSYSGSLLEAGVGNLEEESMKGFGVGAGVGGQGQEKRSGKSSVEFLVIQR